MKTLIIGLFLTLLVLGTIVGCTGSGAVTPLSPAKSSTPDASSFSDSDVVYWTAFPVTFTLTDPLNGVCLVSKKLGWACGNNGTVLKWDGETWSQVETGYAKNENLMAAAFANETEGWIVGTHGIILHYNNGNWSQDASPTEETLYEATVSRSNSVWVVGSNGTLLNYNGISWGQIYVSASGVTVKDDINSISMADQNNGWAVGNRGLILRYDGKWTPFTTSVTTEKLNSVSAINDVQAWAVGAFGTIIQFNGTTWNKMGSAFSGFDLYHIFMRNDSDGWAVGQDGTIIYYDGTRWISHQKPPAKPALNSVAFCKDLGFIVGQSGTFLRFEPNGEPAKFSFLFKAQNVKKPTKAEPYWTVNYNLMNQSPKTSPAVTFSLELPKGLEPYQPKEVTQTPTPVPAWMTAKTITPTVTSTPTLATTPTVGSPTPAPPKLKAAVPIAGTWVMKDNAMQLELGTIVTSELKTIAVQIESKKGEKKDYPVILKAVLKTQDRVVSEAEPLTLISKASAEPSLKDKPAVTPSTTPQPSGDDADNSNDGSANATPSPSPKP
jgi:photosystem II stability/assembly factor-like uncharacterized protein